MKKMIFLAALSAFVVSVAVCSAQVDRATGPSLRVYSSLSVLLLDNDTGETITKTALIFDRPVTVLEAYAIGGGYGTVVNTEQYVWIDCRIDPGGTLVVLLDALADFQIIAAYCFF